MYIMRLEIESLFWQKVAENLCDGNIKRYDHFEFFDVSNTSVTVHTVNGGKKTWSFDELLGRFIKKNNEKERFKL